MPNVIVLAGPNGAGKSTAAETLIRDLLGVEHFVNADTIARGLSAYNPESVAVAAGRVMLERIQELARRGDDFAFEKTLASGSFAPWIAGLRPIGYRFYLRYLWVPTPEFSTARVAGRVRQGGHHVPSEIIARRYLGGLRNLFSLNMPIADDWIVYDNTTGERREIATGMLEEVSEVYDRDIWDTIWELGHGTQRT